MVTPDDRGWLRPTPSTRIDEQLLLLSEGHCPDCRGRLTVHERPRPRAGIDLGRTDSGAIFTYTPPPAIDAHGYCPACHRCYRNETRAFDGEPVLCTWTGCPLADCTPPTPGSAQLVHDPVHNDTPGPSSE